MYTISGRREVTVSYVCVWQCVTARALLPVDGTCFVQMSMTPKKRLATLANPLNSIRPRGFEPLTHGFVVPYRAVSMVQRVGWGKSGQPRPNTATVATYGNQRKRNPDELSRITPITIRVIVQNPFKERAVEIKEVLRFRRRIPHPHFEFRPPTALSFSDTVVEFHVIVKERQQD